MRFLQFLLWVALVAVLLLPFLRRRRLGARRPPALPDELVKDPMCQTYVVRSRAVSRPGADGPLYFCSAECARRYAAETRG